jgi:hypothetical protein
MDRNECLARRRGRVAWSRQRLAGSRMVGTAVHSGSANELEEGFADGRARPMSMGDQVEIPGQLQARDTDDRQLPALDVALNGQL